MQTTGSRIKKIRQELNLSQEQFGKIFNTGKSYISAVENNKSQLSVESLVKLLLNYNVNINFVLGGIGQPFLPQSFEQVQDELTQKIEDILRKKGVIV